jgi:hypothetical protein
MILNAEGIKAIKKEGINSDTLSAKNANKHYAEKFEIVIGV